MTFVFGIGGKWFCDAYRMTSLALKTREKPEWGFILFDALLIQLKAGRPLRTISGMGLKIQNFGPVPLEDFQQGRFRKGESRTGGKGVKGFKMFLDGSIPIGGDQ